MDTYPSVGFQVGSSAGSIDDIRIDRASNGSARGRAFYTARKTPFSLKHTASKATALTLLAFYDDHRGVEFSLPWVDGTTYTCLFAAGPHIEPHGPDLWTVEFKVEQV